MLKFNIAYLIAGGYQPLTCFRYSIVEDNEEEPELPYYIDLFGYKVSIKAGG